MILNVSPSSHRYNKGITQTFYTVLIALITMAVLILILVLFIQRFYDVQLAIQETEQDRNVINLAQALMSSDKLVYVDQNGVVHRAVIDADKAKNINMDDLRKDFTYPLFYYTLTITDIDKNNKVITPGIGAAESLALFANYGFSQQTRNYPVAIRNDDGTVDAGVMSIETGFAKLTSSPVGSTNNLPVP